MSSQGTPRKFSEKIAIMERKQTEDAEAFKSVMQEVRPLTTPMSQHPSTSGGGLAIPPWGRPGGSLPNVHEMVHQQGHHPHVMQGMPPGPNDPSMMGWAPLGGAPWLVESGVMDPAHSERVMHSSRGRSPGAHPHQHFHPYRAAGSPGQMSPTVPYPHRHASNERIPLDYHPHYPGVMAGAANLLQPPDAQWRKARSDPAIHTTVHRYPSISSQGSAGSGPHSPNDYTPPQDVSPPVSAPYGDVPQGSPFYMDPSKSAQNHVDMKPNSCDPGVLNYNSPIASPGQELISSSPGGSLPNLPSPLRTLQSNFGGYPPPPYGEAVNHQPVHHSGHVTVHQRHSIQLPPGGTGYPPGQIPGYNLAATPPYSAESQSAPTSPADANVSVASPGSTYEIQNQMQNIQLQNEPGMMPQQQWYGHGQQFYPSHQPLSRNYSSASPDVMAPSPNGSGGQIPNIVFTGADGSISGHHHQNPMGDNLADCFGDLQDLRLDPQLQQLLSSSDNQVDPASERALRLDHD